MDAVVVAKNDAAEGQIKSPAQFVNVNPAARSPRKLVQLTLNQPELLPQRREPNAPDPNN
jgi:hypothetical protein